jgi:hypothetical protein
VASFRESGGTEFGLLHHLSKCQRFEDDRIVESVTYVPNLENLKYSVYNVMSVYPIFFMNLFQISNLQEVIT